MSADGLRAVFRRLRQLTDPGSTGLSDAELLERYARTADEAAFELLLWRHGPMVLGVCRRLLKRPEDAEDAFQATFLTLVRKARSVRRGAAVGAWLYRVAYRVSLRARASAAPQEKPGAESEAVAEADELAREDISQALDEEIRRLPARYRDPVVLCYLEGRTHAEAARELGCPKGTVAVRLLRARKLLQKRLTRRGVTLAGGVLAIAATPPASAALVARTLRMAFGGPVSMRVTTLTEGVIRAMSFTYVKATAAAVVVTAGLLATGAALFTRAAPPDKAPAAEPDQPATPAAGPDNKSRFIGRLTSVRVRVPSQRDGLLQVVGTEIPDGAGDFPADRQVSVDVNYLVVPVAENYQAKPDERVWIGQNNSRWRLWQETDPLDPKRLFVYKTKKVYIRLEPGDKVKAGQTVAVVDEALARGELSIKLATLDAAESDVRASRKTKEEAERRVAAMEESMRRVPGSVSKDDYEGARLTAKRYFEEEVAKRSAIVKAQQELIQAWILLNLHEIRTPVSGVVDSIERARGEAIKALETVLTVETGSVKRPAAAAEQSAKLRDIRGLRDGVLVLVGTEIKDGETVPRGDVVTMVIGAAAKRYRRLREGDTVQADQLLARLDDQLARLDVTVKEAQLQATEAGLRAAGKTREEAERRTSDMEDKMRRVPGSVSKDDYEGAKLTAARYREEEFARRADVVVVQAELERVKTILSTYEIHSPFRGVIREVVRVPGEAVRVGEPILRMAVSEKR